MLFKILLVKLENSYRLDYLLVILFCKFSDFKKGKGFCKLNNFLFIDKEYVILIKEEMNNVKFKYVCLIYERKYR